MKAYKLKPDFHRAYSGFIVLSPLGTDLGGVSSIEAGLKMIRFLEDWDKSDQKRSKKK